MKSRTVILLLFLCCCVWGGASRFALARELDLEGSTVAGLPEAAQVFAAPFDGAWSEPDWTLAPQTSFWLMGTMDRGAWLWIEYPVDEHTNRIGWIRRPDGCGIMANDQFPSDRSLMTVVGEAVPVTNDPFGSMRAFRILGQGDQVIALAEMKDPQTGRQWVCVEYWIEERPAWGFVEPASLKMVEESAFYTVSGLTLSIQSGVGRIGCPIHPFIGNEYDYDSIESTDSPGDIALYGFDLSYGFPGMKEIVLPDTLHALGGEAFVSSRMEQFRIPGSVRFVDPDAFLYSTIGTLALAKDFTGELFLWDTTVGAYQIEEGNPKYKSVDGVMFSADMKTLIHYPNGRAGTHYDVPAGVEHIADYAFSDDSMALPLQSISLPVGLKTIGYCAFSGCGRLNSIALPLTVTSVDPTAFYNCVSLERVSAPPWITIQKETGDFAAEYQDNTWYNGDNGETADDDYEVFGVQARLQAGFGLRTVPVYAEAEGDKITRTASIGEQVYIQGKTNGRYRVANNSDWRKSDWLEQENVLLDPGATFFTIQEAVYPPEGNGRYVFGFYYYDDMTALFWDPEGPRENDEPASLTVPSTACRLLRPRTGDDRTLGLIVAPDMLTPVWVLNAAGGEPVACLFAGYQAEVLQDEGKWLHIRTMQTDGWIPSESFQTVEQADR